MDQGRYAPPPAGAEAEVLRYAAFTDDPEGGNPAGVVLDAGGLSAQRMLAIARAVGYSETAFLAPVTAGGGEYGVRYFSPEAEVSFCGHATIAAAVALAARRGPGEFVFHVAAGPVPVRTRAGRAGVMTASLTSVPPRVEAADGELTAEVLQALGWAPRELDPGLPVRIAYAGARHMILAAADRERLAVLEYDFARLRTAMLAAELTTIALLWRERDELYHARNPFPVGGVYEDPATGAAAAAFGGYLRALEPIAAPRRITILQGAELGRPSRLTVDVTPGDAGIVVSGAAVPIA